MVEVHQGEKARADLIVGVELLANAVRVTLGPMGRQVAIEQPGGAPRLTKDGASVAEAIELRDRMGNAAAALLRQAGSATKTQAGDGSTTAIVLAHALIMQGWKFLAVGVDPLRLARGIELAADAALSALARMSRACETVAQTERVAMVATNGDRELASIITQALHSAGPEGWIELQEGRGRACSLEQVPGFAFDGGLTSHHFFTDMETRSAHHEGSKVLLVDGPVDGYRQLHALASAVAERGAPLLIVAHEFTPDALAFLGLNQQRGSLKVCPVRPAEVGERRSELLRDLAAATAATLVDAAAGMKLEDVGLDALGATGGVDAGVTRVVLAEPGSSKRESDAYLWQLRKRLETEANETARERLRLRLGRMQQAVAVVKVGADTPLELDVRMTAAKDTLRSAQAAMSEGVIPGGGVAYLRAISALEPLRGNPDDDTQRGIEVVAHALTVPFQQLLLNAGVEPKPVLARVLGGTGAYGFNLIGLKYEDLEAAGIVDAAAVARAALRNAASVALQILGAEAAVLESAR